MMPSLKPLAVALTLMPMAATAQPIEDYGAPYRILQQANRQLDPSLAASAYASDASLIFEYPGQPIEAFGGTDAIRAAYARTFGQVDPDTPIALEFRFDPPGLASPTHSGAYKVNATAGGRQISVYGRFTVKLVKQDGKWRFAEDRGGPAIAADFEKLASEPN